MCNLSRVLPVFPRDGTLSISLIIALFPLHFVTDSYKTLHVTSSPATSEYLVVSILGMSNILGARPPKRQVPQTRVCMKFLFIIDLVALAKQGDNALGSVRPSVWVCKEQRGLITCPRHCLCVCNHHADRADRLLILF